MALITFLLGNKHIPTKLIMSRFYIQFKLLICTIEPLQKERLPLSRRHLPHYQ